MSYQLPKVFLIFLSLLLSTPTKAFPQETEILANQAQDYDNVLPMGGSPCTPVYGRTTSGGQPQNQMEGFHCLYVTGTGGIVSSRGVRRVLLEVAGSPRVSSSSLMAAAQLLSKMVRFMSRDVYTRLAANGRAGIFRLDEKLTVFPEFSRQRNGLCGDSCTGKCKVTCTFDGRKWDDINGAASLRAVAVDENVICGHSDPHHRSMNILVHEMGHLVHRLGMDSSQKNLVKQAYDEALAKNTWSISSYALATVGEYIATATTVYFNANINGVKLTGGLNMCGQDRQTCQTETEARNHLKTKDPLLWKVLVQVYNDGDAHLTSGLSVCPP